MLYKAEEAGTTIEAKNPRNTSKTCHVCGFIKEDLTFKDRQWVCPVCGTALDRDVNAAINILGKIGQGQPELTPVEMPCGVGDAGTYHQEIRV